MMIIDSVRKFSKSIILMDLEIVSSDHDNDKEDDYFASSN